MCMHRVCFVTSTARKIKGCKTSLQTCTDYSLNLDMHSSHYIWKKIPTHMYSFFDALLSIKLYTWKTCISLC
jgi:hypothetical protein